MYSKLRQHHDIWGYHDLHEQSKSIDLTNFCTSDTLVFHPEDPTTDFLTEIYVEKNWDVINDPFISSGMVSNLIKEHDRIICLGHGSPKGLFGGYGFLIEAETAPILKDKEMVAIWCHADQFMKKFCLKGFYSGMFISELHEAWLYGIDDTNEKAIAHSNELFATTLGKHIDSSSILERVKKEYDLVGDPVIAFNREKLYCIMD